VKAAGDDARPLEGGGVSAGALRGLAERRLVYERSYALHLQKRKRRL